MSGVRRALLALLGLVLGLFAAEVGLRLLGHEPLQEASGPRHLFVEDSALGLALRPGFDGVHRTPEFEVPVRIDDLGLRDRGPGEKPPGTFRILSLGDSFAYGYGVALEDSYPRLLERRLNERGGARTYEVVNAAVPGYSTRQMLAMFERHVDALRPDLVLFTFLFVDDLATNLTPPNRVRGGLVLTPYFAQVVDDSLFASLAVNHSQLMLTTYVRFMEWRHGLDLSAPERLDRPAGKVLPPAGLDVLASAPSDALEVQWQVAGELIGALSGRARDAGAAPVLLEISLPFQDDDEVWERMLLEYPQIDPAAVDRGVIRTRLAPICRDLDLPLVNLRDGPRELRLDEQDHYFYNQHFTASGHVKVAERLALFLAEQGLL